MNLFTEIERVTNEIYKWQDTRNFVVWVGGCEEHTHLSYHYYFFQFCLEMLKKFI